MIYVDSCAVVKLLLNEEHTHALKTHLALSGADMVSSALTKVEVCRTLNRHGQREPTRAVADNLLDKIAKLPLDTVLDRAADLDGSLRALDALHVATAQLLGPAVTEFITYDRRLAKAATEAGLPLTMPGIDKS